MIWHREETEEGKLFKPSSSVCGKWLEDDNTIEFGGAVERVSDSIQTRLGFSFFFLIYLQSRIFKGRCSSLCHMGTCDFSIPCFLCSCIIFYALDAGYYFVMHHPAVASMYKNYEAGETGSKEEAKDASSIIYVVNYLFFYCGLKKWTSIPCVAIVHIASKTSKTLNTIPRDPSNQFRHHIPVYF